MPVNDDACNLVTTQVSTLNCAKLVTTNNTALVVLTLSFKWCLDLHKQLQSLTLQSPGLESLRWAGSIGLMLCVCVCVCVCLRERGVSAKGHVICVQDDPRRHMV